MWRDSWGPWRLDTRRHVLGVEAYAPGGYYEIDLEECIDSAKVLEWIVQVTGKSWTTPAVVAGLVNALNDILIPQATICGSGVGHSITAEVVRHRVHFLELEEMVSAGSA